MPFDNPIETTRGKVEMPDDLLQVWRPNQGAVQSQAVHSSDPKILIDLKGEIASLESVKGQALDQVVCRGIRCTHATNALGHIDGVGDGALLPARHPGLDAPQAADLFLAAEHVLPPSTAPSSRLHVSGTSPGNV